MSRQGESWTNAQLLVNVAKEGDKIAARKYLATSEEDKQTMNLLRLNRRITADDPRVIKATTNFKAWLKSPKATKSTNGFAKKTQTKLDGDLNLLRSLRALVDQYGFDGVDGGLQFLKELQEL